VQHLARCCLSELIVKETLQVRFRLNSVCLTCRRCRGSVAISKHTGGACCSAIKGVD
jgi:hypothetical protein